MAASLTNRLLAFSRQQPLQPARIDANDLVGGMSDLLRRTIGETITIETALSGGLWPILADPNQLESAVINLAVNARDAMPEGGKLKILTEKRPCGCGERDRRSLLRRLCDDGRVRRRVWHAARRPRQYFRAVLHDEAHRQRHRPRAEPGLWFRQTIGRPRCRRFDGGRRQRLQAVSAARQRRPGAGGACHRSAARAAAAEPWRDDRRRRGRADGAPV